MRMTVLVRETMLSHCTECNALLLHSTLSFSILTALRLLLPTIILIVDTNLVHFMYRTVPFAPFHLTISFSCDVYRGLGARYRLCMDLVESEEAFRPALSYALGAALVCDSLEDAQELCFTKGEKVGAL